MNRLRYTIAALAFPALFPVSTPALGLTIEPPKAPPAISTTEQAAIFKAAGLQQSGGQWRSACEDPGTASYEPAAIKARDDLNGDGLPEVTITESSGFCYGMNGQNFWLVSKQPDGQWKLMHEGTGSPIFLNTKGMNDWPDITVGGRGFCFPVFRWNGQEYTQHRTAYRGKPCRH